MQGGLQSWGTVGRRRGETTAREVGNRAGRGSVLAAAPLALQLPRGSPGGAADTESLTYCSEQHLSQAGWSGLVPGARKITQPVWLARLKLSECVGGEANCASDCTRTPPSREL